MPFTQTTTMLKTNPIPYYRHRGKVVLTNYTGIYSTRIRLQEGEEKIQAEEKNERLNDDNSFASEELENIIS